MYNMWNMTKSVNSRPHIGDHRYKCDKAEGHACRWDKKSISIIKGAGEKQNKSSHDIYQGVSSIGYTL